MTSTLGVAVFLTVVLVGIGMVWGFISGKVEFALTALGGIGGFLASRGLVSLLKVQAVQERDWMKYAVVAGILFVGFAMFAGLYLGDLKVAGTALGFLVGFLGMK